MATPTPAPPRRGSPPTPPSGSQPPKQGTPKPTIPPRRAWLTFIVILAANFLLMRYFFPSANAPVKVPYTLFKQEITKRNVRDIYSTGESLTGHFRAPVSYRAPRDSARGIAAKSVTAFATTLPAFVDPGLETLLIQNGAEISAQPADEGGNPITTFLFGFGPTILIFAFYFWIFRRAQQAGGLGGGGVLGNI